MMQRKPGYPLASCSIKMPDSLPMSEPQHEGEMEQQQRRQQLINYGHALWGFNNWSWSVTKQDLDFVDFASGKFSAGVVAFVSVVVKSSDIHRENVGYATALATTKGAAIHQSRKCAVTNALRETLLSFGGSVATDLMELLDTNKPEHVPSEPLPENNQNLPNRAECKNMRKNSTESPRPLQPPQQIKNVMPTVPTPIATAAPMPVNLPPAANRPPQPRPPHESTKPEASSEEEARAERKRRQRQAQEEFRLKQQLKQNSGHDEKQEHRCSTSFDHLLMEIPTQDIQIESTGGDTVEAEAGKRKSPAPEGTATVKRRSSVMNRLDIVTTGQKK